MANDLAGLHAKLETALRDTSNGTWGDTELDDLVTEAVAELYPRHLKTFGPTDYTQALTAGTYFYALNSAIVSLVGVDLVDTDGNEFGPLTPGTWDTEGDLTAGTGYIHVAPTIVDNLGGSLRYTEAYGRYDTSTNLVPDDLVSLVIATARAEALRRALASRERYKAWGVLSPTQNVSINEMVQMVSEAEAQAEKLNQKRRTWRKPMPARV